jgi:uncharacterized protein YpmS
MKRLAIVILIAVGAMLLGVVGAGLYFRAALAKAVPFYVEALASDPAELEQASRELESRLAAVYSEAQKTGRWQATFTAAQINSWLAVELPKSFPELMSADFRDPRVAITDNSASLGFKTKVAGVDTVIAVETDVFVDEHGLLAIQLRSVQAGSLPLPTKDIVDRTRVAIKRSRLPCHWAQSAGDPVLLVNVSELVSGEHQQRELETVELHDGEIYLAGYTTPPTKRVAKHEVMRAAW